MPGFGPINYGYYGRIRGFYIFLSQRKEKLHKEMANQTYRSFTHFSVTYVKKNPQFLAGLDQVSVCLFIV